MLADFLWFVTHKCCRQLVHGPAIQRTRDPNIERGGGASNVKASVAFLKTLWKFFSIVSFLITKIMKEMFVLFNHLDNQWYTFSKIN